MHERRGMTANKAAAIAVFATIGLLALAQIIVPAGY
jgi:hypothetical protein